MRIVLIGCSKQKHKYVNDPHRLGCMLPVEVYSSELFRRRVAYAASRRLRWFVVSAAFGLWESTELRNPSNRATGEMYDLELGDLGPADRAAWHTSVAHSIVELLWEPIEKGESKQPLRPKDLTVEIHAGGDYAHPLAEILQAVGIKVELPCRALGIGQQLALYNPGQLSERQGEDHERSTSQTTRDVLKPSVSPSV